MKVGGIKTWKELATGVQQLVRLFFNNNFINPGLHRITSASLVVEKSLIPVELRSFILFGVFFCFRYKNNKNMDMA